MATKKQPIQPVKYMLLDVTSVEATSVIRIVDLRQAQFYGQILTAQGRKVIAPILGARGFAKLDKVPLQYLYWSLYEETPPEDYGALIQGCLAKMLEMPVDDTSHEFLEKEAAAIALVAEEEKAKSAKPPKPPADPLARPKAQTTTGLVWELADKEFIKAGNKFPDRKAVIDACVAEEINAATAATQYSKWRKAKEMASKELPH